MILETEHQRTARGTPQGWEISDKPHYRWVGKNEPSSEWFSTLEEALDWIKEHDKTRIIRD
jgi:hypothetical protein